MSSITAIIPTYNRSKLLLECIASLRDQIRPVDEIIVVDDGSSDDTGEVLRTLSDPIRYFRQENAGKSAALNAGLKEARGAYIWICDDDDLALPEAAELLGSALDGTQHSFVYGRHLRFRGGAARQVTHGGYWPDNPEDTWVALLEGFFIHQFAMLARKTSYEAVGPFRTDLLRSQDYEMALRLARHGTGGFIDRPVFLQREHEGARGAPNARFQNNDRFSKWMEYDKLIFKKLYAEVRLAEYHPVARTALLQRGSILARHKLWDLALDDFRRAAARGGDAEPDAMERKIARKVLMGGYGCPEITADGLADALGDALRGSAWGRALLGDVGRPLLWRARVAFGARQTSQGLAYLDALRRVGGSIGIAQVLGSAIMRRTVG